MKYLTVIKYNKYCIFGLAVVKLVLWHNSVG